MFVGIETAGLAGALLIYPMAWALMAITVAIAGVIYLVKDQCWAWCLEEAGDLFWNFVGLIYAALIIWAFGALIVAAFMGELPP